MGVSMRNGYPWRGIVRKKAHKNLYQPSFCYSSVVEAISTGALGEPHRRNRTLAPVPARLPYFVVCLLRLYLLRCLFVKRPVTDEILPTCVLFC